MQYVLLAYADQQHLASMPSNERESLANACQANDEALRKSGHLLAVGALQSSCATTMVRYQHGQLCVTVGALSEAKEQLIGIFTITARDLNEAIQVAATMPQARGGPIEVRTLAVFEQPM